MPDRTPYLTPPAPATGGLKTVYVADLQCFLCGAIAGVIESDRIPLPASVTWRALGQEQGTPVSDWRRLRCSRCGGALYAEEVESVVRRNEIAEAMENRPRRGRPPKRLVEQRRREREMAAINEVAREAAGPQR